MQGDNSKTASVSQSDETLGYKDYQEIRDNLLKVELRLEIYRKMFDYFNDKYPDEMRVFLESL